MKKKFYQLKQYNTSLGFKLYDMPGQDVKSNMISLSNYHFQPLN